jgi:hypothetical protein
MRKTPRPSGKRSTNLQALMFAEIYEARIVVILGEIDSMYGEA